MEKQVQFRDRQELQAGDLNNVGTYAGDSLQHLTQDAVTAGLAYTGGTVAAAGATEITVAPLRFYNDGKAYVSETAQTLNLFQYLPLVAGKVVAVVVWGQETDTLVEPRDFLIDLTTGATQPQAVAMQRLRAAQVNLLPGAESADPQPPVIQSNTLATAYVYLTPTGIDRIAMQAESELPQLGDHKQRMEVIEEWKALAEPRISSIATDLSALSARTASLAPRTALIEMAADIGRLKARLNLPASYASYQSDDFGDDTLSATGDVGYAALLKNGLTFPYAALAEAPLALFNPYDAGISRTADDLVLPAYTSQPRIKTEGYAGDLSISQYQVQSQVIREYTTTRLVRHYGFHWNYYLGWYSRAWFARYGYGIFPRVVRAGYYTTETETSYELEPGTTSYNGAIIAQSVLVANAMWLTRLGLFFTQIGAAGDVVVAICETDGGKPDLAKTLATVTVPRASLKRYPLETAIEIPPVQLEAGKRYAVAVITQGDHRCAVVSGNNYTQGTLFYGSDGDYFTGDLTKDLMFTLYGAQFSQPRTEVMLQPVSLAGGISDLGIAAQIVEPSGTELRFEVQIGGRWYLYGDEVFRLADSPDLVPLRAVLLGTSDAAPAFRLEADVLTASRAATVMTHISAARTLGAASTNIQVQVVVAQWDEANHTVACVLTNGGTTYSPATTVVKDEPDGQSKRITYTFTPGGGGLTAYKVKISGTKTAGSHPFVVVERTDVAI